MTPQQVYSNPYFSLGWLILLVVSLSASFVHAQQQEILPDLSKYQQTEVWTLINRDATYKNGEVHMNAELGDGILLFNQLEFTNGIISFEMKGKDEPGRSFVGLAFHAVNDSTFDAVYFRPFNFRNPERKNHSVQYISMPGYGWDKLRKDSPGKYENQVEPALNPNKWFLVTIKVEYPSVKVFVNDEEKPILEVDQLSKQKSGRLGMWVGFNSEGSFRNLKISPAPVE